MFLLKSFDVFRIFSHTKTSNTTLLPPICHAESLKFIDNIKGRRFIKSHLSGSYLPQQIQNGASKAKVIYISRNPMDTCVSLYHFGKNLLKADIDSLDTFCYSFITGKGTTF